MNAVVAPTSTHVSAFRPIALLIEPSPVLHDQLAATLAAEGYDVRVATESLNSLCDAALALVEADRDSRTVALARRVRALEPALPLAGVLPWWDDDERDLAAVADLVVHIPLRQDQLDALRRLAADAVARRRAGSRTVALA